MALNEEWWRGVNFLGRPSSLSLTGDTPGDQTSGGTLDAGTPAAGAGPTGSVVGSPAGAPSTGTGVGAAVMPQSSLSPVLRSLLAASGITEKGLKFAQPLLAEVPGAFGAYATPSGQLTSSLPEILRDLQFPTGGLAGLTPAEYGLAATAEFGPTGAELGADAAGALGSELGATVGSQWAGPIFSGMKAFIDFVGEGKVPLQDIINLIAPHTFGPSADWLSFPSRLGQTLQTESTASNDLATALVGANGPQAVQEAIARWRQAVGGAIPGFASDVTDPFLISPLPGAGGSSKGARDDARSHEGYLADFGPMTTGLQALVGAALQGLGPQERIAAFHAAVQPLLDRQAAEQAERDALHQAMYGGDMSFQMTGSA